MDLYEAFAYSGTLEEVNYTIKEMITQGYDLIGPVAYAGMREVSHPVVITISRAYYVVTMGRERVEE